MLVIRFLVAACSIVATSGIRGSRRNQEVIPSPPNDLCESALEVSLPFTIQGTNAGASTDPNIFGRGAANFGPTVWYKFQGFSGNWKATLSCTFDSIIRVISASDCHTYTGEYYGEGDFCGEDYTIHNLNATKQYYILIEGDAVHSPLDSTGSFELSFDAIE